MAATLKISKNGHIFGMVLPLGTKFGVVMQISPLRHTKY